MATEEDLKKAEDDAAEEADEAEARQEAPEKKGDAAMVREGSQPEAEAEGEAEAKEEAGTPLQLGYQRYVYAAYMAGALIVAFLVAKTGHATWTLIGKWKPDLGPWSEPQDEILTALGGVVGIVVAVYYWRKASARQYANEVAEELSKVTWPSRKEVMNSTTVVVLTTIFATVFFALMDQFWKYITDQIYSF
jgi:preprotein translocase subunit SecE